MGCWTILVYWINKAAASNTPYVDPTIDEIKDMKKDEFIVLESIFENKTQINTEENTIKITV